MSKLQNYPSKFHLKMTNLMGYAWYLWVHMRWPLRKQLSLPCKTIPQNKSSDSHVSPVIFYVLLLFIICINFRWYVRGEPLKCGACISFIQNPTSQDLFWPNRNKQRIIMVDLTITLRSVQMMSVLVCFWREAYWPNSWPSYMFSK